MAGGTTPRRCKYRQPRSSTLASERRFYQKITDIYATSIDYDPTQEISIGFFKTVQNKVHWAITGQTAAEIVHNRVDASEKSQVQALDRTQPGLPLKRGRAQTMTHDYKRHGTTTLFAALNILDGSVISQCQARHRHMEWLKFLRQIDANVEADLQIHVVLDNYATHKHPKVLKWLAKHPRFHMHFTATSASWMNMVERFFRNLSEDRLKRGVFKSVDELVAAIELFVLAHNEAPKPFIWTASARDILEKVMRAKAKLKTVQTA